MNTLEKSRIVPYIHKRTVKAINKDSYAKIQMPEVSIYEQMEFARIAEQADKSKFELKQCIENIDKVIKSLING